MNFAPKKIVKLDKDIKRKFSGAGFEVPSGLDLLLKWLPAATALTLTRTKNNFKNKIIILTLSGIIRNSIVHSLKKITRRKRPDTLFKHNSFPSDHTAASFMGAKILDEEVKEKLPALCGLAYAVAVATGTLRVYKGKHWFSDVVTGAAIGVISAKLAYSIFNRLKK